MHYFSSLPKIVEIYSGTFNVDHHCNNFEGFRPFKKGFAADILSREGTDTLVLIPFRKGMKTTEKVFIPFLKGINTKVSVPSLERMSAANPFLKGQKPSTGLHWMGFHSL